MKQLQKIMKSFQTIYYKWLILFLIPILLAGCQPWWDIENPYAGVDWKNDHRYKANFHTHTTRSDGRMNPQTVVDKYHELGYKILAITDHNEVTYPWTSFAEMEASEGSYKRLEKDQLEEKEIGYENRDPKQLGMLAIQGNELSKHHHMGSFFNDHNGTETEEESLKAVGAKNGFTMLFHPGRYTGREPEKYNTDWYISLLKRYNNLIGIEIYNQGDRYSNPRPTPRELYDAILSQMMPERPVWAYSNDDMHHGAKLGRNWNVLLLPELTEAWVRNGMREGRSFYVYSPLGHNGIKLPQIKEIIVKNRKGLIEMDVTGHDSIRWISEGEVIHLGEKLLLKEIPNIGNYVRAEIFGAGNSIVGTQPFGLKEK